MEHQGIYIRMAKDLLKEAVKRDKANEGSNDIQKAHNKGIAKGFENAAVFIAAKGGFIIDSQFKQSVQSELDAGPQS